MLQPREPVQVEVRDRDVGRAVAVADAEARARDGVGDSERGRGAAHERGLPRAELAAHEHEVPRAQIGRELGSERFGLARARRFHDANCHAERLERTSPRHGLTARRTGVKCDRPAGERDAGRSPLLEGWRQGLYRQPPEAALDLELKRSTKTAEPLFCGFFAAFLF